MLFPCLCTILMLPKFQACPQGIYPLLPFIEFMLVDNNREIPTTTIGHYTMKLT